MKFNKTKKENLMSPGQVYVEYKLEGSGGDEFNIWADSKDVEMDGPLTFQSNDDLQDFAKALSDAWKDHLTLKKSLSKQLYV